MFLNGGLDTEEVKSIGDKINKTNHKLWKNVSLVGAVILLLLTIGGFLNDVLGTFKFVYLSYFVLFALESVLIRLVLKKPHKILTPALMYLNASSLFVFGILLFLQSPVNINASYITMMFAVPLLILDRPFRIIILNFLTSIAFIVTVVLVGQGPSAQLNIVNGIAYSIISLIVIPYTSKFRLSSILNEKKLSEQIKLDPLTGLGNRYGYETLVQKYSKKIKNKECEDFAVVMMDINNLKNTNDTYGHVMGTRLIIVASEFVRKYFKNERLYHISGDEFVAVLSGDDYQKLDAMIKEYDEGMKNIRLVEEGVDIQIVIARGYARYDRETDKKFQDVINKADKLMYQNKKELKEKFDS